jgi:hypothetical protein
MVFPLVADNDLLLCICRVKSKSIENRNLPETPYIVLTHPSIPDIKEFLIKTSEEALPGLPDLFEKMLLVWGWCILFPPWTNKCLWPGIFKPMLLVL